MAEFGNLIAQINTNISLKRQRVFEHQTFYNYDTRYSMCGGKIKHFLVTL